MKCGAVIVENRTEIDITAVKDRHAAFLPGWEILQVKAPVHSIQGYNRLLTDKTFWEKLPFDKVLIFQHDSGLLRDGIEEFLDYDYVGAPWRFQQKGGNGGLSLRTPQAMIDVITNHPYRGEAQDGNEDIYFCKHLEALGWNLAPRSVCSRFSVEAIYCLGTLGWHAIDKYLGKEECKKILTQYEG